MTYRKQIAEVSLYLWVIILHVNGLNSPIKHQVARMNKITWTNYMFTLGPDPDTQIDWKWKDGKRYSMQIAAKNKVGMVILISYK